jgi:hypothetical protein
MYSIFLTDGTNTAELDIEDIESKILFALWELQDIGIKKSNIQTITFKGTKKNNNAFGSYFDFSRYTNLGDDNRLFFNYNPIRSVKIIVYEETNLIFVGDLRLTDIDIDTFGNIRYNCAVTTSLSILKTTLSEKYLTDLDFTELQHRYSWTTIDNSWIVGDNAPELYNTTTNTFYQQPQGYGRGYMYPFIDYGYRFNATGATFNSTPVSATTITSLRNFKSAVFLKEYFRKIFEQSELQGFSFEIKGGDDFVNMFNKVIIPETNEQFRDKIEGSGITTTIFDNRADISFTKFFYLLWDNGDGTFTARRTLPSSGITQPTGSFTNYFKLENSFFTITAQRDIITSFDINLRIDITGYTADIQPNTDITLECRMAKKVSNQTTEQTTLASQTIVVPYGGVLPNSLFQFQVPNVELRQGEFVILQFWTTAQITGTTNNTNVVLGLKNKALVIKTPINDGVMFFDRMVSTGNTNADIIKPVPPFNIKQIDFLKSVINQFNLISYTDNVNYKHIIFEPYDSFYYRTRPEYIISNSLDWTDKIDYTQGLKIKTNIELPKSYLFTYKDDTDYLNDTYKKRWNETYGQFTFNDALGLQEQKKVELIFSPTPMTTLNNIMQPLYYKVENNRITPFKIVPRILYYNGYNVYNNSFFDNDSINLIGYEKVGTTGITILSAVTEYAQVSNYYLNSQSNTGYTVVNDIHFAQPNEIYFTNYDNLFLNPANSYQNYYQNQVSEITDKDVIFVECDALLNTIDIANLSLATPVYINTGDYNGAYFKVLQVEYENKITPSRLSLQKITPTYPIFPPEELQGVSFTFDTNRMREDGIDYVQIEFNAGVQNVSIKWGDGNEEIISANGIKTIQHTYSVPGIYNGKIEFINLDDVSFFAISRFDDNIDNCLIKVNVSKLKNVNALNFYRNQLTQLDLTNNIFVEEIQLEYNQIQTIDLSKNINLEVLFITSNNLTQLDLSNNPLIVQLWVADNNLTTLDISNLTNLETFLIDFNELSVAPIPTSTNVFYYSAESNQFTQTDLDTILAYFLPPYPTQPDGFNQFLIQLSNQTPPTTPSAQGITDAAALVALGWEVFY